MQSRRCKGCTTLYCVPAERSLHSCMGTPSPVSWIFKPESSASHLPPSRQYQHVSPSSLTKLPLQPMAAHSPSASQTYANPLTPRAGGTNQLGSPYRAGSASPHSSSGLPRPQSSAQSQDLLLPMMPSTEDTKLHATVSGLRFALQEAQLQLSHSQQQVSKDCGLAFHGKHCTWVFS